MVARVLTPNVPVPDTSRVNPCADCGANSWRMSCSARSWASRSAPSARVVATRIARAALRETHTPPSLRGPDPLFMASNRRTDSPVGSRNSTGLMSAPAGVPSSARLSAMPSRRPSLVKRCALTLGLSR